jgi:hypothetical protein
VRRKGPEKLGEDQVNGEGTWGKVKEGKKEGEERKCCMSK